MRFLVLLLITGFVSSTLAQERVGFIYTRSDLRLVLWPDSLYIIQHRFSAAHELVTGPVHHSGDTLVLATSHLNGPPVVRAKLLFDTFSVRITTMDPILSQRFDGCLGTALVAGGYHPNGVEHLRVFDGGDGGRIVERYRPDRSRIDVHHVDTLGAAVRID